MKDLYVDLVPPVPFRARVVDANFYEAHSGSITYLIGVIAEKAQNSLEPVRAGADWAEQLLALQRTRKIPEADTSVLAWSHLGAVCAQLEKLDGTMRDGLTIYTLHCAMAAFAMDVNSTVSMLQSLSIDGGYYLERTGFSAEALKDALVQGL